MTAMGIGRIVALRLGSIKYLAAGCVVATATLTGAAAQAQDRFPSKPVRIIVSFSAGGPTDIVARVMGAKMSELLASNS